MSRFVPIAANACSTVRLGALADRDHRDHRADADDDAERGQERAHLVAQQRAHRDAQRLQPVHARGLLRLGRARIARAATGVLALRRRRTLAVLHHRSRATA